MSNWLSTKDAASYLGFSEGALRMWRNTGGGPEYVKTPSGSVRYSRDDLDAWITSAAVAQ